MNDNLSDDTDEPPENNTREGFSAEENYKLIVSIGNYIPKRDDDPKTVEELIEEIIEKNSVGLVKEVISEILGFENKELNDFFIKNNLSGIYYSPEKSNLSYNISKKDYSLAA